jgi:hypothetical protein
MRCTGWLPGSCPCCLWGTHDAATTIAACERQVHMMNPRNGWQDSVGYVLLSCTHRRDQCAEVARGTCFTSDQCTERKRPQEQQLYVGYKEEAGVPCFEHAPPLTKVPLALGGMPACRAMHSRASCSANLQNACANRTGRMSFDHAMNGVPQTGSEYSVYCGNPRPRHMSPHPCKSHLTSMFAFAPATLHVARSLQYAAQQQRTPGLTTPARSHQRGLRR